jgi:phosphoglycerate dehydrogenase-like enzyme
VLSTSSGGAPLEIVRGILKEGGCEMVTCPSFDPQQPHLAKPVEEAIQLLAETDVVLMAGSGNPINDRTLPVEPLRLRGVVTSSIGFNAIDVDACTARAILVANAPVETSYEAVVQHTVLLVLASVRRLLPAMKVARAGGGWTMSGRNLSGGEAPELLSPLDAGTTLGVIGLGRIGYRVARVFRSMFGMEVIAYDPYVPEDRAREIGVTLVQDLRDLMRDSDVVTIHCHLSAETKHLIGADEIKAMKPTAYLVNTARGAIVDEAALVVALRNERIAGAALDVVEVEPLPTESPLLGMEKVIVTPHVGGASLAHQTRAAEFAARDALRLLAGQAPNGLVNPSALGAWATRFGATGIRHGGIIRTTIP